jgi:protease-4
MTDNERKDPWLGEPRAAQPAASKPARPERQGDEGWAQGVLERLAFASLKEQRAARRWGIFFKLAFLAYLLVIACLVYWPGLGEEGFTGRHTALVEINGVLADGQSANADAIITGLREAFKNKDSAAVILRINSPGGSPVQAGYVNDEIRRLRAEYKDKKLYAVITDICASGGYYIASAADAIYADKASIVGSIGVLMDGFGFVEAMNKLGVERRLLTAGEHKGFLDPFSPLKDSDRERVQAMLVNVHQQFIDTVKRGRGDRLHDDGTLFSGLTWTGEESLKLGLIDGLGSSSYVARDIVGAEKIVDYTYRPPVFERFADRLGVVLGNEVSSLFRGTMR